MGYGDGQAAQWLERLRREFRQDRTFAVCSVGGLARWTTLSPPIPNFEIASSINGGRC